MANLSVEIAVYADWDGLPAPLRLGFLYARRGAAREIFEFAFDRSVLDHPDLIGSQLDPRLGLHADCARWLVGRCASQGQCGRSRRAIVDRKISQCARRATFLVQRFDRTTNDRRLHFASAMTLTGHKDGDDAGTGASYLEMARVLIDHGVQTNDDLRELWTRIVFNLLVSNTDDHLRNHGFILVPGKGWRLSKAYDMNPADR